MSRIESPIIRRLTALAIVAGFMLTSCAETHPTPTPTPPSTRPEATKMPELTTPTPTLIPFIPTEIPSSSKNIIEIARSAQLEAFQKGEFRIPLPQELISTIDGTINVAQIYNDDSTGFLSFNGLGLGQSATFPSLIEGKIINIFDQPFVRTIDIQSGNDYLRIQTVLSAEILVKRGETPKLGDPLFSFTYNNSGPQQAFSKLMTHNKITDAVVIARHLSTRTGDIKTQDFSNDNGILFDKEKRAIFISTSKPNF